MNMNRTPSPAARVSAAFLTLLATLALTIQPAKGQVLYGSIVGSVQDSSGSAISNAKITIVNTATGQSHEAATTGDGLYSFIDVLPGVYTVPITAPGFRTSRTNNTQVTINNVTREDAQLQVGERAEAITVEASAAVIQADSADVHVAL